MQIEQYPPNKPNFLLVVVLAGVTLLIILVLAYFFIDFEGGHIHFRHRHPSPNAQLLGPVSVEAAAVWDLSDTGTNCATVPRTAQALARAGRFPLATRDKPKYDRSGTVIAATLARALNTIQANALIDRLRPLFAQPTR